MERDGWVEAGRARIPRWLANLDLAVWVVDAEGIVTYVNARAEELLGAGAERGVGHACRGTLACPHGGSASCANRQALRAGQPVRPFVLVPPGLGRAALAILPVPLAVPGGEACLVHVGIPLDGTRRIERYWQGVVAGAGAPASARQLPAETLSPREAQVLERLASGLDQKSIARELHVSYATVRNHAQRILRKLRVHSLQAAIGMHLLHGSGSSADASAAADAAPLRDASERAEPRCETEEEKGEPPRRFVPRSARRPPAR